MVTKTSETSSSYKTISSTEAQQMIEDNKDALILDVRTAAEYESGHIPNAVNLSNEDIQAGKVDSLRISHNSLWYIAVVVTVAVKQHRN